MKVRGTDTFSDDIPIVAARLQRHFLLVHDIFQLATYFTNLKSGKKNRYDNRFIYRDHLISKCHF